MTFETYNRVTKLVLGALFVAFVLLAVFGADAEVPRATVVEVGRAIAFFTSAVLQAWLFSVAMRGTVEDLRASKAREEDAATRIRDLSKRIEVFDAITAERTSLLQNHLGAWTLEESAAPEVDACPVCGEEVFFRRWRSSWYGPKLRSVAHVGACGRWCVGGEVPPGEPAHACGLLGCGCPARRMSRRAPLESKTHESEVHG